MLTNEELRLLSDLRSASRLNDRGRAKLAELEARSVEKPQSLTPAAGTLEAVLQGVTFGASDEAQAAAGALYDVAKGGEFGQSYTNRQQALDTAYREFAKQHPGIALAGNVAGAITPATMGGKAAGWALSKVPAFLRYPLSGATAGGVAGAASAPAGERLSGAAEGAAVGGALGVAVPMAVGAAKGIVRAPTRAKRAILNALERDRIKPTDVAAKLAGLPPEATLVDAAGPNTMALTEAAQSIPGKAKAAVQEFLEARQEGMQRRILEPLQRTFGGKTYAYNTFFALDNARRAAAKPAYQEAYAFQVQALPDDVKRILATPAGREAWRRAARIAANDTEWPASKIPSLSRVLSGDVVPDMRTLDYIKRGLSDVVEKHKDKITGRILGEEGKGVADLERKLRMTLREINPAYGRALDAWSGPTQAMHRLQEGQRFLKDPAELTTEKIAEMTDTDKAFFRLGVASALESKVASGLPTHDITKFFRAPLNRQKLSSVFPDDASFMEFMKTLDDERLMNKTYNTVLGNSRTAAREAAKADLVGGDTPTGAIVSLASGRPVEAATSALQWLVGRGRRQYLPGETSEELASMLVNPSKAATMRLLDELRYPPGLLGRVPTLPVTLGGAVTGGLLSGR